MLIIDFFYLILQHKKIYYYEFRFHCSCQNKIWFN